MWFIQIWTSRIMSFSVVVLASILASQIAFIYIERGLTRGGREEEGGNGTLYAESKNTDVSFRMAALLNAGVRALRCLYAT